MSVRRYASILVAIAWCFAGITGCGGGVQGRFGWLVSLSGSVLWGGVWWALLWGLLGFVAAGLGYWLLSRWKAFNVVAGRHVQLARVGALCLMLLAFPASFAYMGFFEGALRASARELSTGRIAQEHYAALGGVGADYVGVLLLIAEAQPTVEAQGRALSLQMPPPEELEALAAAFRSGEREIEAARIPALVARFESQFVTDVAAHGKQRAMAQVPLLRDGPGRKLLDWLFSNFGEALVVAAARDKVNTLGLSRVTRLFKEWVERLPEAALQQGDPQLLSHHELSRFIVEATLADGMTKLVIQPFCRGQQIGTALLLLLVVTLSVVAVYALGFFRRRSPVPGPAGR